MNNNNWEFDYSELYKSHSHPSHSSAQGQPVWQQQTYGEYTPPPQKSGFGKRVGAFVLAVIFCGAVGFGGGYLGSRVAGGSPTVIYQTAGDNNTPVTLTNTGDMSVADIVNIAAPTVVEITTETVTTNSFFGQYVTSGAGSGVIISSDGYIVTNDHVVNGAEQITVMLHNRETYTATLIGTDSKTDVAVLKIEATDLPAAVMGDSSALSVGEFALAIGNPLGSLGGTVTDGIISALDREITVGNESMTLLQTNAAVSPGNSGGGLFNARGELIGVVNAKSSDSNAEGLGFAIPVNTVMSVSEELITRGYVSGRPAMGITVITVNDVQTAMQYGVNNMGVYVQSVNEGSSAQQAGLQPGDLFVSIDGTAISSTSDITSILNNHAVGDTVEVQVMRNRQMVVAQLTLQESQQPTA